MTTAIPWFAPAASARVADVVRRVESQTSAEIVVTVRAASDAYRDADLLAGSLLGFLLLCVYLYAPVTFTDDLVGPAVALAFTLGFLLSARVAPVRRLFLARGRRRSAVRAAAREAFVDQSIATTRGRTGVLVFVSLLERRVEVVPDVGVTNAPLPAHWETTVAALERSLEPGLDLARFEQALAALAAPLSQALPRQDGDVNELPDEVRA